MEQELPRKEQGRRYLAGLKQVRPHALGFINISSNFNWDDTKKLWTRWDEAQNAWVAMSRETIDEELERERRHKRERRSKDQKSQHSHCGGDECISEPPTSFHGNGPVAPARSRTSS